MPGECRGTGRSSTPAHQSWQDREARDLVLPRATLERRRKGCRERHPCVPGHSLGQRCIKLLSHINFADQALAIQRKPRRAEDAIRFLKVFESVFSGAQFGRSIGKLFLGKLTLAIGLALYPRTVEAINLREEITSDICREGWRLTRHSQKHCTRLQ